MNTYIIIIFGLATVRTLTPLEQKENWNQASIANAITMIVSYVYLVTILTK
jgi:hypothetical protein